MAKELTIKAMMMALTNHNQRLIDPEMLKYQYDQISAQAKEKKNAYPAMRNYLNTLSNEILKTMQDTKRQATQKHPVNKGYIKDFIIETEDFI